MLILRCQNNSADIMVPISRHRSPSRLRDWTQKHGTGANISAPECVMVTGPESEPRDRCQYYGADISASESVMVMGPVLETLERSWKHRTRHGMLLNKLESDTATGICNQPWEWSQSLSQSRDQTGIGLGKMEPVLETQNQTWNAPEHTRTRQEHVISLMTF